MLNFLIFLLPIKTSRRDFISLLNRIVKLFCKNAKESHRKLKDERLRFKKYFLKKKIFNNVFCPFFIKCINYNSA